jgi:hypothetical protein
MSKTQLVLLWCGFGCFCLAAINITSPINLVATGLALCTLASILR